MEDDLSDFCCVVALLLNKYIEKMLCRVPRISIIREVKKTVLHYCLRFT